jgi:signal peptidase I
MARKDGMASKSKAKGGFVELVKTVVYALLLAGVIRTVFFQPFWIPSGSMKPTLMIGDFLFVNKMAYGYSRHSCPFSLCPFPGRILASAPERGDVVVFKHPTNGTDYIKRLIGLPGDRIQMVGGILHINGEALPQEPDGTFSEPNLPQGPMRSMPRCANRPVGAGEPCVTERAIETLPEGKRHPVLDIENGFGDDTPVFTVPEGQYFFMGDNRDNSMDSRFPRSAGGVGAVPFENLIGRADRVIFSSAGPSMLAFWTWRPDRFFVGID